MSCEEDLHYLTQKLTRLEAHVQEQDAELYRISRQLDKISAQMDLLQPRNSDSGAGKVAPDPANEKPPHY